MVQLLLPIIYISFISLGLPDSLLGSAWPSMYPALGVPVSYAGLISMIISFGTIVSSLNSDRLTRALGTGKVTALSVGMTAAALFGFSVSTQFWMLCLWAVPYGLGAGSVDAALNNYVALHYKSRHMSWLHCMWGIGTMISPMVMGRVLAGGGPWTSGYRYIALFQILLSAVLFFSLPLWQGRTAGTDAEAALPQVLSLGQVFRLPGAREVMLCFFCYCALETTAGLWASSYLTLTKGVAPDTAASFASLFYIGITAGRAACGFLTLKFNDTQMIRMGQCILAAGVLALLLALVALYALKRILARYGKGLGDLFKPAPPQPPHVVAIKALEALHNQKLWQNNRHKQYYSGLTDILRTYIAARWGVGAMEMTSDEIIEAMRSEELPDKARMDLTAILRDADLVKFAKATPDGEQNEADYLKAFYFVEETKLVVEEEEPEQPDPMQNQNA